MPLFRNAQYLDKLTDRCILESRLQACFGIKTHWETDMKRFWSLILFCLSVSSPAMAAETEDELGFWFEGRTDSKKSSQVVGWYERQMTDRFGIYGLVNLESDDRYRQAYAGLTVKPLPTTAPWLQLGVGVGRERDGDGSGIRKNLFVSVDAEKVDCFATYETGYSGPWHRINCVYHTSKRVSVGAMQETNLGIGPRVEYHIKKNLTVWSALFRDRAIIAVNFSF